MLKLLILLILPVVFDVVPIALPYFNDYETESVDFSEPIDPSNEIVCGAPEAAVTHETISSYNAPETVDRVAIQPRTTARTRSSSKKKCKNVNVNWYLSTL